VHRATPLKRRRAHFRPPSADPAELMPANRAGICAGA
jgi:hypothetical protein